ncbi:bifunctional transaldolase/phosoglucose isomerase [Anaerolineales bacterium]
MSNPAIDVQAFGQSIWLDYIHRQELMDGTFQKRLDNEGILGVTSNPSIFQNAIGESEVYDSAMSELLDESPEEIYEKLAVEDIRTAADLLRPIYDRTNKIDGYVSFEVSPLIASDTEKTVSEAERLFKLVDRPNVMIKIPATPEGIPAIEASIAKGVNINVTLIFSVMDYIKVVEAYLNGLEKYKASGGDLSSVASVASFFLSRIDVMVDGILENNIRAAQVRGDTAKVTANSRALGQAAIANAKLAYSEFKRFFYGERFRDLKAAGAQVQRPLWASTGTKNPAYPDTKYVDNLIGKHTVNTLPPKTLAAFIDHGTAADTIDKQLNDHLAPHEVMNLLKELNVDMDSVTAKLQVDGVDAFSEAFEKLNGQVAAKQTILQGGFSVRLKAALGIYEKAVKDTSQRMSRNYVISRLWQKDGSLWKDHGPTIQKIVNRLGWLDILETIDIEAIKAVKADVASSDFTSVVLLGMGGSSLAPEVLYETFGRQEGFPDFRVLDSTDPVRIREIEAAIDIDKTLFIVASKSGSTLETASFYRYFYDKKPNGDQFIAITDPGSELEAIAKDKKFRHIFLNPADIGGRYSALSYFGMVPAATMGLDIDRLWESAEGMIQACAESVPNNSNPGAILGKIIATVALEGRDKLNIHATKSIASFGNWIEQLVAESIGKEGKGILPVVNATVGKPHDYATDRLFIYIRVDDDEDVDELDHGIRILREAGHPRVTVRLADAYSLAGEFFRWEFATAVMGYILEVNPFDEPNVTEAKNATQVLIDYYNEHGQLPKQTPVMTRNNVALYANDTTLDPLRTLCHAHGYDNTSLVEVLAAQFAGTHASDYFAFLVYVTPDEEIKTMLADIQRRLRHVTKRAVTIGFGPRYLHSTGQLHKGGPNSGIFITLTANSSQLLAIPDVDYDFNVLFAAQAEGDLQALQNHQRRVLRLHLGDNIKNGLNLILTAIEFVEARKN